MATPGFSLPHFKQSLDSLSAEVEQGIHHASLLRDLKFSVDQLRLTIWAAITHDESIGKDGRGAVFGLADGLAEFRVKRLLQLLLALQEDFRKGSIAPSNPDLSSLASALHDTLENISKLVEKKGKPATSNNDVAAAPSPAPLPHQ